MPVWYWLPGLLGHSPSHYVDPWASRTHDPKFCIFACRSRTVTYQGLCGLLTGPQPLLSTHCLKVFCSTGQKFTHSGLGLTTTFTGLPPVHVLLSQMTSDDFFAHNKGDANSFVRRDSTSPLRGHFISFFISRYSMMPGNPYQSDLIIST